MRERERERETWKLFKDLTIEPTTTVDVTDSFLFKGGLGRRYRRNVTGQVSDISNHDTGDLTEGTNQYFTQARAKGFCFSYRQWWRWFFILQ